MNTAENSKGPRLVEKTVKLHVLHELEHLMPAQNALFPVNGERLLVFVTFSKISGCEFLEVLAFLKPHMVVDIRRFPRFENGALNRQRAFDHFEQLHTRYIDLLWSEEYGASATANPIFSFDLALTNGPIMVLMEAKQTSSAMINSLAQQVSSKSNKPWDVIEVPATY